MVLNLYKVRLCFILWSFSNGFYLAQALFRKDYAQFALFSINLILSVIGFLMWKPEKKEFPSFTHNGVMIRFFEVRLSFDNLTPGAPNPSSLKEIAASD